MQTSKHFLDSFFNPSSIAVIGASKNPSLFTFNVFNNLVKLGYQGRLYPVNPGAGEIAGIRAYTSLRDIEDDVELVVSVVSAGKTLDIMKECVEKGVKGIVLVSGGFSEIGERGIKMQDEIARILKQNGIRAIGPNTLSPVNFHNKLVVSFFPVEKIRVGTVSFIFQSGMYDLRLSWLFENFHLGVSKIIDLGNKMDVNEVDALEYLSQDKDTKTIGIHLETIRGDSKKFVQLLKNTSRRKPTVVLKTGRTEAGANAAASHTGSIVKGSDVVFDIALKQAGVIRAQDLDEFFDFVKAFDFLDLPSGNRCIIGSVSGGEGVLATDLCQQEGFLIAKPSVATVNKIKAIFPPWEIPVNPLDIGVCFQFHDPAEPFVIFFEAMADDPDVDCLVVQLPQIRYLFADVSMFPVDEFCKPFLQAKDKGMTIVTWAVSANRPDDPLVAYLESHNIPVYPSASRAIKALGAVCRYRVINLT